MTTEQELRKETDYDSIKTKSLLKAGIIAGTLIALITPISLAVLDARSEDEETSRERKASENLDNLHGYPDANVQEIDRKGDDVIATFSNAVGEVCELAYVRADGDKGNIILSSIVVGECK